MGRSTPETERTLSITQARVAARDLKKLEEIFRDWFHLGLR